eukprot:5003539-Pyramimonas_sp.AAC.1
MSTNRLLSLPALQPPYSPSNVQKTDSTSQDDSNHTNSFADLVRAADRVPSSRFDRRTRLMSSNRFL